MQSSDLVQQCVHTVSRALSVSPDLLTGPAKGSGVIPRARALASYLASTECELSDKEIAKHFNRDRSSITHMLKVIEAVRIQSARMVNAWNAADREATLLGAKTLDPQVWETTTPDGEVLAIVQSRDEASKVIAEGRSVRVVTLEEVGRLIGKHFGQVLGVLAAFEGARVVAVREPAPINLVDAFDHRGGGDELSF